MLNKPCYKGIQQLDECTSGDSKSPIYSSSLWLLFCIVLLTFYVRPSIYGTDEKIFDMQEDKFPNPLLIAKNKDLPDFEDLTLSSMILMSRWLSLMIFWLDLMIFS